MKSTPAYQNYALSLLRFYPRAWRERYADEAAAVLEERPATLRTLFDLFLGMLDAHLHNDLFIERKFAMLQRLRNTQLTIFCLFILSILSWGIYLILRNRLINFIRINPGLQYYNYVMVQSLTDKAVNIAGLCAFIAVLIGSIVLVSIAVKQAVVGKRKKFSRLFTGWSLSALGLVVIIVLFYFVEYIRRTNNVFQENWLLTINPHILDIALLIVLALFVWVALIGPFCLLVGTRKAEFSPQLLGTTIVPALLTTLAISIMALAMLVLAIEFFLTAPDFGTLKSVIFFNLNVVYTILLATFSTVAFWRGYSARRKLALA